ncbi:MAG: bifunctional 4-hydroxy-2-oxoglutarate aldolase/2-dehydro-3-deoxy-phosphogluconate aldolase [Verrucomicrobiota bacterium]
MNSLLESNKILPVVQIENPDDAVPLAEALLAGGISAIEVTFRTENAARAIRLIRKELPQMTVAAGTVLTLEQAQQALDAGAHFGLSPGLDAGVIQRFQAARVPFVPGVATPTEISRALDMGCTYLKFFPARQLGGIRALKAVSAPFGSRRLRFCPTGGLDLENFTAYLELPEVFAVGGTWVAPTRLIQNNDWAEISARAGKACQRLERLDQGGESMIRTVLGDIHPDELGVCYAHEHIIIDHAVSTLRFPEFKLESVSKATRELSQFHADGGRSMVDSMPCDAGRNVLKLAEVSRQSGVHILCPTGLHLAKYYDDGHWSHHYSVDQITDLFLSDIAVGIDRFDYSGPFVDRTPHRAGLIKIATEGESFSARDEKIFEAAAHAHRKLGTPILTHVENGIGALQQVEKLAGCGVDLNHVVLSHTDRHPELDYHREVLQSGVQVEYDSAFRWKTDDNPTLELVVQLIGEFPDQIMLGMDAARPAYWRQYGGEPGLSFLLNEFSARMRERGLTEQDWQRIFVSTPARTYHFKPQRR